MFILALSPLALLAAGPLLAYLQWVEPLTGLALFSLAGPLGLLIAVVALLVWVRRREARYAVAAGLAAPAALAVSLSALLGAEYPPINDVTTDVDEPPRFAHSTIPYPQEFTSAVREHYPELRSLEVRAPQETVFDAALNAAKQQPRWRLTHVQPAQGRIQAVATTSVFRFKDDVVVRVRHSGEQAVVDVRSRSRVGEGDRGVNARRIREYLHALGQQLETSQMALRRLQRPHWPPGLSGAGTAPGCRVTPSAPARRAFGLTDGGGVAPIGPVAQPAPDRHNFRASCCLGG